MAQGDLHRADTAQTSIVEAVDSAAAQRAGIARFMRDRIAERAGTTCPHGAVFGDPTRRIAEQPVGTCDVCTWPMARALAQTRLPPFGVFRRNLIGDATQEPLHLATSHLDAETRAQVDALVEEWLGLFGERIVDPFRLLVSLRHVHVQQIARVTDPNGRICAMVHDQSSVDTPRFVVMVSWRDGLRKQRERALLAAAYVVLEAQGVTDFGGIRARCATDDERQAEVERTYQTIAYFARALLVPEPDLRAALVVGADLRERFAWASRETLRARLRDLRVIEAEAVCAEAA